MQRHLIFLCSIGCLGAVLVFWPQSETPLPAVEMATSEVQSELVSPDFELQKEVVAKADEPAVEAKAVMVMRRDSGEVLYEQAADESLPIASITKLMAASIVYERFATATATITVADVGSEGAYGKLVAGESYTLYELMFPLLVESSNDAAAVIERVTDGEVITLMNERVATYGLTATHFTDASGLSSENRSTARELAILLSRLYTDYPHVIDITKLSHYVGSSSVLVNNNPVHERAGFLGGKHGYTDAAGRTLVAAFDETITTRDVEADIPLLYVILGAQELPGTLDGLAWRVGVGETALSIESTDKKEDDQAVNLVY